MSPNRISMKVLLLVTLLSVFLLSNALPSELELKGQFEEFKMTFGKQYDSQSEHDIRFQYFKDNVAKIERLNSESRHATFAVNKFADMSEEEFKEVYLNEPITAEYAAQSCLAKGVSLSSVEEVGDIPESFDWRTTGKVSPVKDQEQCGSCWTFSTTGVIESAYAIAHNTEAKNLLLSEQAVVDCSHNCSLVNGQSVCNSGCGGGWPWAAVTDVIRWGGLPTESEYPYTGMDGSCQMSGKKLYAAPKSYTCLSGPDQQAGPADEKVLMPTTLMKNGPLSIALNAGMMQFYFGGVMDPFFPNFECSGDSLDHAVLIVGWGIEHSNLWGKLPYWIVKNSWGASWGEEGYVRMYRGEGLCGLNAAVMSVTVN
eukprot:TRINITY_DN10447_c0_g1_i1.p1 TRINITY_DN10447_c0_g1~~TRINITY_DN10447_c0_g1_i1.p1  ORF type:complete len:369 (+),score=85.14 TRINITY_DN10447_c0_g1_i1:17-1123(+)